MKSKKILLILTFLFIHLTAFSQQIGAGFTSFIPDFSVPLLSGVYNGVNATGATPDNAYGGFQHLFVIRHVNTNNNHQLQIASSMESNGRLFFRKLSASSLVNQNPVWHEIATLGINNFVGNQSISGDLKIASYSPLLVLQRNTNVGGFTQGIQTKNLDNTNNWFFGNFNGSSWIVSKGDYQNPKLTVLDNGNLGIGTTTPAEKVQVTGGNISIRTDANGTWGSLRLGSTNGSYLDSWAGLESDNEVIGTNVANLKFYTSYGNRSEKMRITASGNVGIGTTTPRYKLDTGILAFDIADGGTLRFGQGERDAVGDKYPTSIKAFFKAPNPVDLGLNFYVANANTNGATEMDRKKLVATMLGNGNVGIGTTTPDKKLTVNGTIHSSEVIVDTYFTPDYVFQKYYTGKSELKSDYSMPTLAEIESFIKKNHHLPNVPSAQEIKQNGLSLGEMSNVLLQKVEELTIYAIEQNKKLILQQEELQRLKIENESYKSLAERLSALEKELKK